MRLVDAFSIVARSVDVCLIASKRILGHTNQSFNIASCGYLLRSCRLFCLLRFIALNPCVKLSFFVCLVVAAEIVVGDIGLSRPLLEANALSFSLFGIRRIEDEIQIALL